MSSHRVQALSNTQLEKSSDLRLILIQYPLLLQKKIIDTLATCCNARHDFLFHRWDNEIYVPFLFYLVFVLAWRHKCSKKTKISVTEKYKNCRVLKRLAKSKWLINERITCRTRKNLQSKKFPYAACHSGAKKVNKFYLLELFFLWISPWPVIPAVVRPVYLV